MNSADWKDVIELAMVLGFFLALAIIAVWCVSNSERDE